MLTGPAVPVQLLWTGGWDSSFRLLQLLLVEHRPVQPLYVVFSGRTSTLQEVRTMERMREQLLLRLVDPSLVAPTRVAFARDFRPGPSLHQSWAQLAEQGHLGTQYLWLAAIAEAQGWHGVELSVERYEHGASTFADHVVDERGQLRPTPWAQLFGWASFPLLHLTKEQMRDVAAQHGFLDLLQMRWFCHQPLFGRPCGRCRPCRLAVREDVTFANPVLAAARSAWRRARRSAAAPAGARRRRSSEEGPAAAAP